MSDGNIVHLVYMKACRAHVKSTDHSLPYFCFSFSAANESIQLAALHRWKGGALTAEVFTGITGITGIAAYADNDHHQSHEAPM